MKQCSRCKHEKELTEFSKNPTSSSGYRSTCKLCDSKLKKSAKRVERVDKEGVKECHTCKESKPFSEFARNSSRPDMVNYECKACEKARRAERKAKDINYAAFYLPVNYY